LRKLRLPILNLMKGQVADGVKPEMFAFLKNRAYPIGVDIDDDMIKVVQLAQNSKGINLISGGTEHRPQDVQPGSSNWQRWAIDAIRGVTTNGKFRGREVIAVMPTNEVFIDHIKMPRIKNAGLNAQQDHVGDDDRLREALLAKIKQKLPFEPDDAMIKYIPAEQDNVVVITSERTKIDRHLAIYEEANLQIKSIGVWPTALINTYTTFFGRRQTDTEAIVMLLEINASCTNVVICRHKNLLFARSIPIGTKQLQTDEAIARLVMELTACKRHFSSMHRNGHIARLIFLTGQVLITDVFAAIAKQLEMPAQMGNCLAAVTIEDSSRSQIDRRDHQVNWATAFGLSLSLSE